MMKREVPREVRRSSVFNEDVGPAGLFFGGLLIGVVTTMMVMVQLL